jgi:hypothetical protein
MHIIITNDIFSDFKILKILSLHCKILRYLSRIVGIVDNTEFYNHNHYTYNYC